MPTLTKSFIEKLEPKNSDFILWDDKLTGFAIKVTPTGRKVYFLKYRTQDGRQRKPTIGIHGQITCEMARKLASEWLGERARGNDPSLSRQTLRQSPNVSELCDRFITEYSMVHKKSRSIELAKFYIEKYIKPNIGMLKVTATTKHDLTRLHSLLKSTPVQANRIITLASKIFNKAEDWGLRPTLTNPAVGIQKYKEEKHERYLSSEEIHRLSQVLDKLERDKQESYYFLALIRLLMLTGARLSEIQFAKWEWLDWENGVLNLPDSKTGKKTIHLSPAAIQVLRKTPIIENNPFIIVGEVKGNALYNAQKQWRRVRKLAGIEDVRIHDLRHTFASLCVSQGMSLHMVAKLLGHASTTTSERYAHLARTPVQEAAAAIGRLIQNAGAGAKNA